MEYTNITGKAALFMGADKPFDVVEYPVSSPENGYALLKLKASGICGTDLHIRHGRLGQNVPRIIGHEFIGEVADINCDDSDVKIGDTVIFNMATPCGKCKLCTDGDSANCLHFEVAYDNDPTVAPHFFGGYGEYCYAKASRKSGNLIKIPDGVDVLSASMFPCAGPTIIHALKLGGIFGSKGAGVENAVVQGAGPLGLFASIWLSKCGVKNIYTVMSSTKSARAQNVRALSDATPISFDELDKMIADGFTSDLCIECSGNPAAFLTGCNVLRNRGKYLIPGQYSDSGNISFGPQMITFKALQLIGSSQYDASDVADYISFLDNSREILPALAKCVKTFPVCEINEALACSERHEWAKVVLI